MRRFVLVGLAVCLCGVQVLADGNSSTEPPVYNVIRANAAPVIDGVVSPGEWDAADAAAGDWVNLRAHTANEHNLRFQAMWDEEALYIVGFTDYENFGVIDPEAGFIANPRVGSYAPAIYIDPNTDSEWEGLTAVQPNSAVDGYQIQWDIHGGFSSRRPTPAEYLPEGSPPQRLRDPLDENGVQVNDYFSGLFLEAHANSAFGNDGSVGLVAGEGWGPNPPENPAGYDLRDVSQPGLIIAQNASSSDVNGTGIPGAVWELSISWDMFNATDPNRLVTAEEADARGPEMILDDREFLLIPDPDFPFDPPMEVENPDFGMMVRNVGQFDGIEAWIGNAGEPDRRFSDPEDPVFIDNGLYAVDGPEIGDVWAFEMGAATPDFDNPFGSWSEPLNGDPGRGAFAPWGAIGHGRLIFAEGAGCDPNTGGDLDGNGKVEFADFLILSGNFGNEVADHTQGDIDCNGSVGFADFLVLSANFGTTVGEAASVPEPSGLVLLSLAGAACGVLRRRRS